MKVSTTTTFLFVAILAGFAANARADYQNSYTFYLTSVVHGSGSNALGEKDAKDYDSSWITTFDDFGNVTNTNPYSVVVSMVNGGAQFSFYGSNKVKDWFITGFEDYFASGTLAGGSLTGDPPTKVLSFTGLATWDSFANAIENGSIEIFGHAQNVKNSTMTSINLAKFTYVPQFDTTPSSNGGDGPSGTPEPATMLIMGLGLVGAGYAARRRLGK